MHSKPRFGLVLILSRPAPAHAKCRASIVHKVRAHHLNNQRAATWFSFSLSPSPSFLSGRAVGLRCTLVKDDATGCRCHDLGVWSPRQEYHRSIADGVCQTLSRPLSPRKDGDLRCDTGRLRCKHFRSRLCAACRHKSLIGLMPEPVTILDTKAFTHCQKLLANVCTGQGLGNRPWMTLPQCGQMLFLCSSWGFQTLNLYGQPWISDLNLLSVRKQWNCLCWPV